VEVEEEEVAAVVELKVLVEVEVAVEVVVEVKLAEAKTSGVLVEEAWEGHRLVASEGWAITDT